MLADSELIDPIGPNGSPYSALTEILGNSSRVPSYRVATSAVQDMFVPTYVPSGNLDQF